MPKYLSEFSVAAPAHLCRRRRFLQLPVAIHLDVSAVAQLVLVVVLFLLWIVLLQDCALSLVGLLVFLPFPTVSASILANPHD
jgi:hypothetical protein